METTPSVPKNPALPTLAWVVHIVFYTALLGIIATSKLPTVPKSVFFIKKQFLAGNEILFRFQDPGLSFALFDPYASRKGSVSFLMDAPYDPEDKATEQLQAAQGRLAPLLLNVVPSEQTAFVFCSQNEIASARIKTLGYTATAILGDGKMIAEKKP